MSTGNDRSRIEKFARLFSGRLDAVGGDEGRAIYKPYTLELVEAHLNGVEPFGVYPTWPDADGRRWTRWGCCDIDTGEWSEAFMLATALTGMGLKPHVERSRSKGWHVWVFVEEPVEAWQMRRCLKVAYAAIDLPAKEANPKSEQLAPSQLGNYVRLPYPGAAILNKDRQVMMWLWDATRDGNVVPFTKWIDQRDEHIYSDPDRIKHWADKWYEKPRRTQGIERIPGEDIGHLVDRLDHGWRAKFLEGTASDRSQTIVALGYWCARRGWSPQDVYALLWWSPWNKYADRTDGDQYIADIVERVFS